MLKFIHAADLHLDSPFAGLPPEEAALRRRELRETVDRLADYVRAEGVELVLLAGDLFDTATPYRDTCEQLARALERMAAPVFIAPGNHDFFGSDSLWQTINWPENVHIFKTAAMETVELDGVTVSGGAFTGPEQGTSLLAGFAAPADGRVHLGVLHGEVEPAEARYGPIRREEIEASGLDYLALGHIHRRGALRCGKTVCAWPGCPQGRGFDELGEKGFCQGVVSDDGRMDLTFVPFAVRRYEILEVNVTGRDPLAAVAAALPEGRLPLDCYRVILTGETGEPVIGLEDRLPGKFGSLEIRDHTRPPEDLWARAGEDTLRGLFLRDLQQQLEAAETEAERESIAGAARFGLAALDRRDMG